MLKNQNRFVRIDVRTTCGNLCQNNTSELTSDSMPEKMSDGCQDGPSKYKSKRHFNNKYKFLSEQTVQCFTSCQRTYQDLYLKVSEWLSQCMSKLRNIVNVWQNNMSEHMLLEMQE